MQMTSAHDEAFTKLVLAKTRLVTHPKLHTEPVKTVENVINALLEEITRDKEKERKRAAR